MLSGYSAFFLLVPINMNVIEERNKITMKKILPLLGLLLTILTTNIYAKDILKVVTTLPDYAFFAKEIGGDRVSVVSIVRGDQDAHFIRPKPSFATALRNADLLVATGLDLELWIQTVTDNSGNGKIRSGQVGYVSASPGQSILDLKQANPVELR